MNTHVYTTIDTSENAPDNQGAAIRDWDRAWREAGYQTRILVGKKEAPPGKFLTIHADRPN